ncbi:unnamed protein product [Choristocarpus tenellus]
MNVLFVNAHVWQWSSIGTGREPALPADWLLISRTNENGASGRVVAVGAGNPPLHYRTGNEVIDLKGALILPGLQDAHIHLGLIGESTCYVDLSSCSSREELQEAVRVHGEARQDLPWVIGVGWDQNLWATNSTTSHAPGVKRITKNPTCDTNTLPRPSPPSRQELDDALPDGRPCLLYRRCWHSLVANSAAIQAASLDPNRPRGGNEAMVSSEGCLSVKGGGSMELDEEGCPTGLFLEGAMQLVEDAVTASPFETSAQV